MLIESNNRNRFVLASREFSPINESQTLRPKAGPSNKKIPTKIPNQKLNHTVDLTPADDLYDFEYGNLQELYDTTNSNHYDSVQKASKQPETSRFEPRNPKPSGTPAKHNQLKEYLLLKTEESQIRDLEASQRKQEANSTVVDLFNSPNRILPQNLMEVNYSTNGKLSKCEMAKDQETPEREGSVAHSDRKTLRDSRILRNLEKQKSKGLGGRGMEKNDSVDSTMGLPVRDKFQEARMQRKTENQRLSVEKQQHATQSEFLKHSIGSLGGGVSANLAKAFALKEFMQNNVSLNNTISFYDSGNLHTRENVCSGIKAFGNTVNVGACASGLVTKLEASVDWGSHDGVTQSNEYFEPKVKSGHSHQKTIDFSIVGDTPVWNSRDSKGTLGKETGTKQGRSLYKNGKKAAYLSSSKLEDKITSIEKRNQQIWSRIENYNQNLASHKKDELSLNKNSLRLGKNLLTKSKRKIKDSNGRDEHWSFSGQGSVVSNKSETGLSKNFHGNATTGVSCIKNSLVDPHKTSYIEKIFSTYTSGHNPHSNPKQPTK